MYKAVDENNRNTIDKKLKMERVKNTVLIH